MRERSLVAPLTLVVMLAAGAIAGACSDGSGDPGDFDAGGTDDGSNGDGNADGSNALDGLASLAITPADAVVVTTPDAIGTLEYKVTGTFKDGHTADVTSAVDLELDDPKLGTLLNGHFSANADHGGRTNVTATGNGVTASTSLTVKFQATVVPAGAMPGIPADPGKLFTGTADASKAPQLVYPNDSVMLPANLSRLEVHFKPGASNTLFEISFSGPTIDVKSYVRCTSSIGGGCVVELDPKTYAYVAETGRGQDAIDLRVRGTVDAGGGFGESSVRKIQFSETDVQGALYYWTTSSGTGIMRFDFGKTGAKPETFLSPSTDGFPTCVGCHALSRDGTKLVASLGGQNDGRLVYLNDLKTGALTKNGDGANAIQFASFNPDGSRFAAIYGDTSDLSIRNKLWMHDGTTGARIDGESITMPWEPDHPDWSPAGDLIALTRVGEHRTSQRPIHCGIELLAKTSSTWGAPVTLVPQADGKSRYNPNFAPDGSFLLFSESTCPGGDVTSNDCDGDSDPNAKTWAVVPKAGSKPTLLARANTPGTMDGTATDLGDTFPRMSPFKNKQGKGEIYWATISSRRHAGLRDPAGHQLLWMFAIDPAKVRAGSDGSYPAFFLPFQDLTTSNHIGQWTTQAVGKPPAIK